MHQLKFFLVFLFPLSLLSQNISGKIYDEESTVKGAKIFNSTKNSLTYTDDKGNFELPASINDTLIFTSLFHKRKRLKLVENHFKDVLVIELKKVVNDLDEVLVTKENKTFNEKRYTADFGLQLKNDMKNNPHLYSPAPSGNIDVVKIIGLVSKLFKRKRNKETPIIRITYKQLDSLFSKSHFFNKSLLTNDLKIPKEFKYLFFEYCDAQQINRDLLKKENRFLLLDKLIKYSHGFLVILSENKKE
jgi:hypothetical protein